MASRDFHHLLRVTRERRRLTQQELAEKIGKREKDIGRWEGGQNMPQIGSVTRLAEALSAPELVELALEQAKLDAGSKRARRGTRR
jgi:transcriptional regulator with XRE-family HTH domain